MRSGSGELLTLTAVFSSLASTADTLASLGVARLSGTVALVCTVVTVPAVWTLCTFSESTARKKLALKNTERLRKKILNLPPLF